jgi:hypothetical protein
LVDLASIEFALHLAIANDLSVDEIRNRFHDAQVCEPTSLTIDSCSILSLRLLDCATRNLKMCRTEIFGRMPDGLFMPKQQDLLYQWIHDGKNYTRGSRLPASNYEKNAFNHQLSLTDEASHYIRHIICVYHIRFLCVDLPACGTAFQSCFLDAPCQRKSSHQQIQSESDSNGWL